MAWGLCMICAMPGGFKTILCFEKVIRLLESLLTTYKRIMVKDSAVNAFYSRAKLMVPGPLRSGMVASLGLKARY